MHAPLFSAIALTAGCLGLLGCGQRGPLVLPSQPAARPSAPAAPQAPAGDTSRTPTPASQSSSTQP